MIEIEDAKWLLNLLNTMYCKNCPYKDTDSEHCRTSECFRDRVKILECIKKQIPMDMVIKYEKEGYFHFDNYYCPSCGVYLGSDRYGGYWTVRWCNQCGQRVTYDNDVRLSRMCGHIKSAVPRDEWPEEDK